MDKGATTLPQAPASLGFTTAYSKQPMLKPPPLPTLRAHCVSPLGPCGVGADALSTTPRWVLISATAETTSILLFRGSAARSPLPGLEGTPGGIFGLNRQAHGSPGPWTRPLVCYQRHPKGCVEGDVAWATGYVQIAHVFLSSPATPISWIGRLSSGSSGSG